MDAHQPAAGQQGEREGEHHIDVVVITTSGTFPAEGFDSVPLSQPIKVELSKAQHKLEIADTSGWIVTVGSTVIDANKSYIENRLHGSVKLDWGPTEGGGGKKVNRDA